MGNNTQPPTVPQSQQEEEDVKQPPLIKPLTQANSGHKTLATAANLANLLPTGTVLLFQAMVPSFSNSGKCVRVNQYLTLGLVAFCSVACFLSSFTDSFISSSNDKLYYGIATFNSFYVFNDAQGDGCLSRGHKKELKKYRLTMIDWVHAFTSLIVFWVVAIGSNNVQECFFTRPGQNTSQLILNLPLGVGVLASSLFTLFPTTRRGLGIADTSPQSWKFQDTTPQDTPKSQDTSLQSTNSETLLPNLGNNDVRVCISPR